MMETSLETLINALEMLSNKPSRRRMMETSLETQTGGVSRIKFIVGGVLILAAVVYLIVSSTSANAQFFLTIDEMVAKGDAVVGRDLRISGAVVGDTIQYDPDTLTLTFDVAHMPGDNELLNQEGGLAAALHQAVIDPSRTRVQVVYVGPKPDLLRDEAQAIMTGRLGENGIFYADELLLKCPTRYDEYVPDQSEG